MPELERYPTRTQDKAEWARRLAWKDEDAMCCISAGHRFEHGVCIWCDAEDRREEERDV